jgi:hypothetical protein
MNKINNISPEPLNLNEILAPPSIKEAKININILFLSKN